MGRIANVTPEQTRRKVLDHARELFAERGQGSTSIRDIAGASGVSLATVLHHFGSKDDLYAACIEAMYQELEPLQGELGRALRTVGGADDLVAQAVRACYRFACGHRPALRLIMRSLIDEGELDPERRRRRHIPLLEEGSALVAKLTGLPSTEARLRLQSIVFLVVRYALSTERELGLLVGLPARTARPAVERHLVAAARALLSIPSHP